jgi:large subunit ribosomal protein L19
MSHQLLRASVFVTSQLKSDIPDFRVGSLVSVYYKIKEGEKYRIQIFTGIVTNRRAGNTIDASFTVNKNSFGAVKVERVFPLHSPLIEKIEVVKLQRSRRSNLSSLAFSTKDLSKTGRFKKVKIAKTTEVEPVKEEPKVEEEVSAQN